MDKNWENTPESASRPLPGVGRHTWMQQHVQIVVITRIEKFDRASNFVTSCIIPVVCYMALVWILEKVITKSKFCDDAVIKILKF